MKYVKLFEDFDAPPDLLKARELCLADKRLRNVTPIDYDSKYPNFQFEISSEGNRCQFSVVKPHPTNQDPNDPHRRLTVWYVPQDRVGANNFLHVHVEYFEREIIDPITFCYSKILPYWRLATIFDKSSPIPKKMGYVSNYRALNCEKDILFDTTSEGIHAIFGVKEVYAAKFDNEDYNAAQDLDIMTSAHSYHVEGMRMAEFAKFCDVKLSAEELSDFEHLSIDKLSSKYRGHATAKDIGVI